MYDTMESTTVGDGVPVKVNEYPILATLGNVVVTLRAELVLTDVGAAVAPAVAPEAGVAVAVDVAVATGSNCFLHHSRRPPARFRQR